MGDTFSKPRPTVQEIANHLEVDLLWAARILLETQFGQSLDPNHSGLQDAVGALVKAEFRKAFGYDWSPTSVSPPTIDLDNPQYHLASDYCIIPSNQDSTIAIANYVDHGLRNIGLDGWMKGKAVADMAGIVGKYINSPVDSQWHYGPHTAQYDAVDPDEDSYKLDLSIVYTNATKTESAVEVSLHIFYFVGVYYTIKSPKVVAFSQLRKHAWDAATHLKNVTESVSSDAQLETALYQWSTGSNGVFHDDFKRDWNAQPDDFATDETCPVNTRNGELAFFNTKDLTEDFLKKHIDANFMTGFNFPIDGMRDWLQTFLLKIYQTVISHTNTNRWSSMKLDETYGLKNASIRPIRANGEIIYWTSETTILVGGHSVTVAVYYIYFLGFFYELMPDPIYQDLSRKLVQNIPGLGLGTSLPSHISPDDVQKYVEEFNKTQFADAYNILFPPDSIKKNNHNKNWKAFFEFNHWNPSEPDIQIQVAEKIFQRDPNADAEIHHGLQQVLYDWIVKFFAESSANSDTKDPNKWYSVTKTNTFAYSGIDKNQWALITNTSWAYCNGTITEHDRGEETLSHFYLSVLIYAAAVKVEDNKA